MPCRIFTIFVNGISIWLFEGCYLTLLQNRHTLLTDKKIFLRVYSVRRIFYIMYYFLQSVSRFSFLSEPEICTSSSCWESTSVGVAIRSVNTLTAMAREIAAEGTPI